MTTPHSSISLNQATLQRPEFQKPFNNALLVQQYVTEQKSHALQYAKDGVQFLDQWKGNNTGDSTAQKTCVLGIAGTIAPSEQVFTLSSPLLKPRVPHHPQLNILEAMKRLNAPKADKRDSLSTKVHRREKLREDQVQNKQKPKLSDASHYLDEHQARLMERRERRRAKRAIVSPPRVLVAPKNASRHSDPSSSITPNEPPLFLPSPRQKESRERSRSPTKKNKRRSKAESFKENTPSEQSLPKRQKKRTKLAAGLALMQNFQAKNIGRERITLKASKVGVFNKGVASTRTNVSRKKKNAAAQARNRSLSHVIFNEEAFLNGTRLPKAPPSHSSLSSASGSSGSKKLPCSYSSKHRKSKHGRSRRDDAQSSSPSMSGNSEPASPIISPQDLLVKPNTDRVSRFFRKHATAEKSTDTPTALEQSQCDPSRVHERCSSPPWDIDWAAEGLPASPSQPDEPHSPIEKCDNTANDTILSHENQREHPASVSPPTATHDMILPDPHVRDAPHIGLASLPGHRPHSMEPFLRQVVNAELGGVNDTKNTQPDANCLRGQRPSTASSRYEWYPTSPDAFRLAAPAIQTHQGADSGEMAGLTCGQGNTHFQVVDNDEWSAEEVGHRRILNSARIQNEQSFPLAPRFRGPIATELGPDINNYGDPSYLLHFSLPSHSLGMRTGAASTASQSQSEAYGVADESPTANTYKPSNQNIWRQDSSASILPSPAYCHGPGTYQSWDARSIGGEPVSPSQAFDEPSFRGMDTPQVLDSKPVQYDIDNGHTGHLFPSDSINQQSGQPIYSHFQANQEYEEFGICDSDPPTQDLDAIGPIGPHPTASEYEDGCRNVYYESRWHRSVPATAFPYEATLYEATLDEAFSSPLSANNSAAPDRYTADAHNTSDHYHCRRDTSTPAIRFSTLQTECPQSPSLLSRSPSPTVLCTATHKPFQQGRALLLGIETVSPSSDIPFYLVSIPDGPLQNAEHAGRYNSTLLSVAQELERGGYWANGDARRCR